VDYVPRPESALNLQIKRLLDELYLIDPCLGTRRLVTLLKREHDIKVNRKRLQRLRREMGLEAIYCKPRTSIPDDGHRKYPYLLRDLAVERPNQVWCTDLCAVMDWHSRRVLGWSVSNTMETGLCLEALEKAFANTGQVPEIFNTDQGCQFTSEEWISRLEEKGIKVSMDGKGRWMDNVFIERLWRSVEHGTIIELCQGLEKWFERYNDWRPHAALENRTPTAVYQLTEPKRESSKVA